MKYLTILFLLVMAASAIYAQVPIDRVSNYGYTLATRVDAGASGDPEYTTRLKTPFGEINLFNVSGANKEPEDWQIGYRPLIINDPAKDIRLCAGVYYAHWNWSNAPAGTPSYNFVVVSAEGRMRLSDHTVIFGDVFYYIPTDGGPHALTSNDIGGTYDLTPRLRAGISGQYNNVDGKERFFYGPRLGTDLSPNSTITASGYLLGTGNPNSYRVEFVYKF